MDEQKPDATPEVPETAPTPPETPAPPAEAPAPPEKPAVAAKAPAKVSHIETVNHELVKANPNLARGFAPGK